MKRRAGAHGIEQVSYRAPPGHRFGVEVISTHDFRGRVSEERFKAPQRVGFYLIIAVVRGTLKHTIDFVSLTVRRGDWLVVRPGQVQRLDLSSSWDGYLLPIQPELLQPQISGAIRQGSDLWVDLNRITTHLRPEMRQTRACLSLIAQIAKDARLSGPMQLIEALLRDEVRALLTRLLLAHHSVASTGGKSSAAAMKAFTRYRDAIEANFQHQHRVSDYATALGYSERSLARYCLEVAGVTAKTVLDERIVLEAKRLLTHTPQPSASIALELGFEDASFFVKFFKRKASCTPKEFRDRQRTRG